jgi:hypothetical protein
MAEDRPPVGRKRLAHGASHGKTVRAAEPRQGRKKGFDNSALAGFTVRERFRKRALRLRGTLPHDEARWLQQSTETLRGSWR